MNIRTNRPVQYRITFIYADENGIDNQTTVDYGFGVEPTPLKLKIVARNIEQGISRTFRNLTFKSYEAVRIGA